jgi:hypothetical protein
MGLQPEGLLPEGLLPEGLLSGGLLPEGLLPEGLLPEGLLPEGLLPEGLLPEVLLPEGLLPEGLLPERFLPEGLLPEGLPHLVDSYLKDSHLKDSLHGGFVPEGLLCQVHDLLWGARALDGSGGEGKHGIPSLNNHLVISVLRIQIRDTVLFWPLGPGSGMEKNPRSFFREHRNSFFGLKILTVNSSMQIRNRDMGSFLPGSGFGIEKFRSGIRDPA